MLRANLEGDLMPKDEEYGYRKSIRLPFYDYSGGGFYFVTLCTSDWEPIFGKVEDGKMKMNEFGQSAEFVWDEIPQHFPNVEIDAFVIMPNHVHGVIVIKENGNIVKPTRAQHAAPLRNKNGSKSGSLGVIVRSFKSAVTREINLQRGTPGVTVWQRNYYEHVIRDERDLERIREYIENNPLRWALDEENPENRIALTPNP
jgi:REP element-mobilizing transposase RayT